MSTESRDGPKRPRKSKQTEPAETIPRDVDEFVGTVAHEVQSIARLARGLCEADASQESAALIKRRSGVSDEGVDGASKSLLDRPLGEILDKKNVHVAEDEAVASVGNLATVIASRLNILHEFAQAVQERSILGTAEGLQYLDKHRAAHYPRIVPLVEPTAGHRQLAEENAQLKEENALIQKEADELAHDLGKRDAEAELNSVSSSRQPRRRVLGLHIWIAIPLALFVALGLAAGISWSSAVHYYDVAGYAEQERQAAENSARQAQEYEFQLKLRDFRQLDRMNESRRNNHFQKALILADATNFDRQSSELASGRVDIIIGLLHEIYGELPDEAHLRDHLLESEDLSSETTRNGE